jgi:Undecaprenyl-phosphate glucose phosphotransferase
MMPGTTTRPLETRRSAACRLSLAYRLCKFCSPAVAADLTLLLTATSVAGTAVLSHALYYPLVLDSPPLPADYALIGLAVALVYFFTARFVFHLDFEKLEQGLDSGSQSVKALLVAATIFLVAVFLTQTTEVHSRGWFLAWMVSAALVLMLLHVAVARLFEKAVRLPESPYRRRVAVFGTHELVASFAEHLSQRRHFRTSLVHSASILSDISDTAFKIAIDHFIAHCRQNPVSEVVIALPGADERRVLDTVSRFASLPVDVRLAPDQAGFALARHQLLGGAGLPLVTVSTRPIRDWGKLLKELVDRLGAALLLAFLAPLFLVVAAAIKLDSRGPVFFRQPRNGFNHSTFMMWKFRSMQVAVEPPDAPYRQATRNDPRITRVGGFLRRTSIDELPQLINVLKGEMSLVGPRPHPIALDDQYMSLIDQYATRHAVLPGITGWAQVNGYRGETDTDEKMAGRIAHDLNYIRNWSFSLDFWILCLTVIRGFVHKNAY